MFSIYALGKTRLCVIKKLTAAISDSVTVSQWCGTNHIRENMQCPVYTVKKPPVISRH